MTDTGQVPGEGQPENAGMVEQPGVPAPGAYTFLDPSENTAEDDDLLLMPGSQGAWGEPPAAPAPAPAPMPMPQPVPAAVDPVGAAVIAEQQAQLQEAQALHQAQQPVYELAAAAYEQAAPVAPAAHEPLAHGDAVHEPVAHEPAVHEPVMPEPAVHEPAPAHDAHEAGAHEAGGRDSGSVDLTGVRMPEPAPAPEPAQAQPQIPAPAAAPAPARRPLHMGPPVPDASGGVVRSLADRGPANPGPMAPGPMTPGPATSGGLEYLDVPRDEPVSALPGPQFGELPPQSAEPWSPQPQPSQTSFPAPAETVVPEQAPAPAGQFVPVEGSVPTAPHLAPTPPPAPEQAAEQAAPLPEPEPVAVTPEPAPDVAVTVPAPRDGGAPAPAAEPVAGAPEQVAPEPVAEQPEPAPAEPVAAEPAPAEVSAPEAPAPDAAVAEPAVQPAEPQAPAAEPVAAEAPEAVAEAPAEQHQAAPEPSVPAEQPTPEQPVAAESPAPEPAEPAQPDALLVDQPPAAPQQTATDEPVASPQPVAPEQPTAAADSATPTPAAADVPDATEPVATEPVATEPVATEPVVIEPAAAEQPEAPQQPEAPAQTNDDPAPAAEPVEADQGAPAPGYDDVEREAVLRVMRERRDIRNGFRSDPIPHEVLLRVLEAAHTAPSVGHSQPWDFVVIRSAETRRSMHELAQRQREAYAKSLPKGRAKQFKELKIEAILDTPVNIVVTADPTRGGRHTLGRHTQPQMAPYSSALAVENLWLAARAEGLGVGWVSFFDEREMVRALGLPEHLEVVAYLCVGYVDEFPEEPELMQAGWSKRRPLSWVVHEETYGRRALPGEEPHDLLQETVANIRPLDAKALGEAWERQKRMTKPAGALGMLEIISAQLSGLSRMCPPPIPEPAAVAIFAGDHGVHAQGVTAWPQEVTAQMVANFLGGGAVCNAFANQVGAEVCVIDVGVAGDLPATPGLLPRKVRPGTADFTTGPALSREDVLAAVEVGIETARDLVAAGNKALLTGEMGIANTTTSAALISVYTDADAAEVTGRGTGINDEMHARKVDVVRRALELHRPDPADPIGVLAAVGGLEHAALVGLILGGASLRTPVVLDGVSAGAAALVARAIAPEALAACIAGHRSAEPGHLAALNKLGLRPLVDLDLRLGEGTGALLALPVIQSAARAMHEVATFDSAGVTEK
ncbi:nicotinate-nucleotide--dimethylbenzimidazole phosphoribosyltransferase [Streptomyces ficellus]|uniref:Nicotinate-nucleotide--dimethylbenzimidazole phosphoribosyltransferase n=1 Tax=Streptomyces ficellus TaxID=1977088 RepID=A0A6I6FJK8_9ACTN|nr:nicotinate-nucleotide--dimethylbenzimidazole phosphoribosyltransferase [Streptomyces ficellus]QGV81567.1 nicotinate-nucleotide--dimethylbenzimidazole phosphoribosyltransferase [Streptomyces ficellus]